MKHSKFIVLILSFTLLAVSCGGNQNSNTVETNSNANTSAPTTIAPSPTPTAQPSKPIVEPMTDSLSRITLKPFGLKVSPQNSPVSPEKFTGIHVGTDFEATTDEQNINVPVKAVCDGKVLSKRTVNGYGGLLTQDCKINGEPVTVLYGHVRLSSISATVGTMLKAGEQFAVLGTGYSAETSNERKHLHLGIVKGGGTSEIRGYVQTQAETAKFMDAGALLK